MDRAMERGRPWQVTARRGPQLVLNQMERSDDPTFDHENVARIVAGDDAFSEVAGDVLQVLTDVGAGRRDTAIDARLHLEGEALAERGQACRPLRRSSKERQQEQGRRGPSANRSLF